MQANVDAVVQRDRAGDDQDELAEVVGQTAGHLVGSARPHPHTPELVVGEGGAQAGADVLGEREVRHQGAPTPIEITKCGLSQVTGGDIRRLCDLFRLSASGAERYLTALDHPKSHRSPATTAPAHPRTHEQRCEISR